MRKETKNRSNQLIFFKIFFKILFDYDRIQFFNTFSIGTLMKNTILILFFFAIIPTFVRAEIDLAQLEIKLKSTGLVGEIHGASPDAKLFVLSYRNPTDFFDNIQLPLTTLDSKVLASLREVKRHQAYLIKGEFVTNKAPIKHINVTSLELTRDYTSELDQMPYQYRGDLNELKNRTEFVGRVHAVGENGKMLVMEYVDRIIPVFVTEPVLQKIVTTLYRGDLVKIKYKIRRDPGTPTHLSPRGPSEKPIELLESLVKSHGTPIEKTGSLIRFSKSPQINSNIYALLLEDVDGTTIQYTLTNFDSPEIFKGIREKLERYWDDNAGSAENDRNKMVNRKLKVHAKGLSNMVDAGQANPQILINSIDDLTVEVLK